MNGQKFYALTGYQFRQIGLLEQALTHRSYSRSNSNERLEFLGDSILNLIISIHIYRQFSEASEGQLSRIRAALVKQATLAQVAREIELGDHVRLGGGELKSGGQRRASILADALEAVIGAVYLDGGFAAAEAVVLRLYRDRLDELDESIPLKDAKTRLQEYLQARKMDLPSYSVEQTTGKAHDQTFVVSCSLGGSDARSTGHGTSRKQADRKSVV